MGRFIKAELVGRYPERLRYWVFNGSDRDDGEFVNIVLDDVTKSFSEGSDELRPMSRIMVSKMFYRYERTGEWPQHEAFAS
jgi:hypothetical protein